MTRISLLVAAILLLPVSGFAQDQTQSADDAANQQLGSLSEKASYVIGYNIGMDISDELLQLNTELVMKGIQDALAKTDHPLTPEEITAVMQQFEQAVTERRQAQMLEIAEKNRVEGAEFLRQNALQEGVKQLESGLQYKVLVEGEGPSPGLESIVRVNYRGTLINGDEFDSSYARGEPAEFPVGRVIQGWVQALPRMKVGSKWQIFVPAELAYREQGSPPVIGPNQVLIFEIELLAIVE